MELSRAINLRQARYGLEAAHEIALIATRHGTSAWPDAVYFMDGAREAEAGRHAAAGL